MNGLSWAGQACSFIAGAAHPEQWPAAILPEIAFVGRSNVGKSSLLNAVLGRRTLARVSKTPGCTQQINFFQLDKLLFFVDLPGYGYANISKKRRQGWSNLIPLYLKKRSTLRRVYLLIDSRHGFKDHDLVLIEMLETHLVPYQVVLTKADQVQPTQLQNIQTLCQEKIQSSSIAISYIVITSARKKRGIDTLRTHIDYVLSPL